MFHENFECDGEAKPRTRKQIQVKMILNVLLLWLYSPCGPWPLFQLPNLYTVGRSPWTGDQPVARQLPAHRTTRTQNKRKQASMPWVGFEPTIPAFERAKTVHALDRAATVIVSLNVNKWNQPSGKICDTQWDGHVAWRNGHLEIKSEWQLRSPTYIVHVTARYNSPIFWVNAWAQAIRLCIMSTRSLPGGKGLPARNADNFTTTSEPIV
jgi:hypothetical protein